MIIRPALPGDVPNVYSYNAESYNPNMESQYLRVRYYNVAHGNFLTEDSYLGNIIDPLTLNRYNYVKSSPLNYIDPSGHVPSTTPDSPTSPYNLGYSSNGSNESACRAIDAMIRRHHGALIGGATGVAIVMLTAATGGSAVAIFGLGIAGGANGLIIGGIFHKGVDSVTIAHELETKYGYNVAESQDIEVSELPESAQELCEQYQETIDDTETYLKAGTAAGLMGSVLFEAGMLLDSIDQIVTSASKNAYEKVKNWVSGAGSGPGTWEKINEAMSDVSRNYQKFVTGAEDGMVYKVNGVKFNGFKNGTLIEAKGNYSQFVNKTTGKFQTWFNGKEALISQANRQLNAANDTKIQWFFNDEMSLNAVKNLFKNESITDIELIFKPMQ